MKRSAAYRWVLVGTLVAFLSLAVVACSSADGNEAGSDRDKNPAESAQSQTAGPNGPGGAAPGEAVRGRLAAARGHADQERREARMERQLALLQHLRDDMTAEDQQQYDQLMESIKEQRAAVEGARQELAATLKELRVLIDEYLDANGGTTE